MENSKDKMLTNEQNNQRLGNAITHALEVEKLFKLYSYRIIDQFTFVDSVRDVSIQYDNEEYRIKDLDLSNDHENS